LAEYANFLLGRTLAAFGKGPEIVGSEAGPCVRCQNDKMLVK